MSPLNQLALLLALFLSLPSLSQSLIHNFPHHLETSTQQIHLQSDKPTHMYYGGGGYGGGYGGGGYSNTYQSSKNVLATVGMVVVSVIGCVCCFACVYYVVKLKMKSENHHRDDYNHNNNNRQGPNTGGGAFPNLY